MSADSMDRHPIDHPSANAVAGLKRMRFSGAADNDRTAPWTGHLIPKPSPISN